MSDAFQDALERRAREEDRQANYEIEQARLTEASSRKIVEIIDGFLLSMSQAGDPGLKEFRISRLRLQHGWPVSKFGPPVYLNPNGDIFTERRYVERAPALSRGKNAVELSASHFYFENTGSYRYFNADFWAGCFSTSGLNTVTVYPKDAYVHVGDHLVGIMLKNGISGT